jgi:hypothetical protein
MICPILSLKEGSPLDGRPSVTSVAICNRRPRVDFRYASVATPVSVAVQYVVQRHIQTHAPRSACLIYRSFARMRSPRAFLLI